MDEIMATGTEIRLAARVEALEAELAEARKDSRRLEWLESKGLSTLHNEDGRSHDYGVHCWEDRENKQRMWTARYISSELPSLRAAIDAAMAREGK